MPNFLQFPGNKGRKERKKTLPNMTTKTRRTFTTFYMNQGIVLYTYC